MTALLRVVAADEQPWPEPEYWPIVHDPRWRLTRQGLHDVKTCECHCHTSGYCPECGQPTGGEAA